MFDASIESQCRIALCLWQLFSSRRRVRLFLMDVEDEVDDDPTDTSQTDYHMTGCDLTSATDDSSYVEVDDENKENSDTTIELLL